MKKHSFSVVRITREVNCVLYFAISLRANSVCPYFLSSADWRRSVELLRCKGAGETPSERRSSISRSRSCSISLWVWVYSHCFWVVTVYVAVSAIVLATHVNISAPAQPV